ncbi:MAG: hypothetical protein ABIG96_00135 [Candidatus Micrarchaeota archaeon]
MGWPGRKLHELMIDFTHLKKVPKTVSSNMILKRKAITVSLAEGRFGGVHSQVTDLGFVAVKGSEVEPQNNEIAFIAFKEKVRETGASFLGMKLGDRFVLTHFLHSKGPANQFIRMAEPLAVDVKGELGKSVENVAFALKIERQRLERKKGKP